MGRMMAAAGIFLAACASASAQELVLNAGSVNGLIRRALDSFVMKKADAGDQSFSAYRRDGGTLPSRDPGKYINEKPSLEFDLSSSEILVHVPASFGGKYAAVEYREKISAGRIVRELDDRTDMTGYRDKPEFRDIMLEELTSYRCAYFFAKGTAAVRNGDIMVSFVPLETLPSFVPSASSFSCALAREARLNGNASPYCADAESGFDRACVRFGVRSTDDAQLTAFMGPASVERREYSGMHVPAVSGRVELAKGAMTLASAEVTGESCAQVNAQAAESAAYALWGERCAEWAVRALVRTSFRLDPSGIRPVRKEQPTASEPVHERDVQVVCRLKAGETERNPFLSEFEAAFLSVFSGSKSPTAPYSAVIELAPVYDQGPIGSGFVSKRVYCIVRIFRGRDRIYSVNVSDAAVGLAGEAAGKDATIKAGRKAAQAVKDFVEGKQPE